MTQRAERYIVVCRGPHCRARGSWPLRKRLVALLRGQTRLGLVGYACFGQCDYGPTVAFYPEGVWYGGLSDKDAADRVVRHAAMGEPLAMAPLTLTDRERADHLHNIAELVETYEQDRARQMAGPSRRWPWWPFRSRAAAP